MGAYVRSVTTSFNRRRMIDFLIKVHRLLSDRLGPDMFLSPTWDLLFDIYARGSGRPMSITDLSMATKTSQRTAIRHMESLIASGMLRRLPDSSDRRRTFIQLTPHATRVLNRFFDDILTLLPPGTADLPE